MLKPWAAPPPDHSTLFLQRYERLLSAARRLVGGRVEQAKDLVHDAFLQFVLVGPDLATIENLDAYLHGMIRKMHLSWLRRAARHVDLSAADYDSAPLALRVVPESARLATLQELAIVCRYASARKSSSKAGSVLILRYFRGFYPDEIALLMRTPSGAVAQWLRHARAEARLAIEAPHRLRFPRTPVVATVTPPPIDASTDECLARFRAAIDASRDGVCLSRGEWQQRYAEGADTIDCQTLAHLVSCPPCLDKVIDVLGGPRSADRDPTEALRRNHGRTTWGEQISRRADLECHRPKELHVVANGFVIGSQKVRSETSEISVRAHLDEPLAFVEVFSDQWERLLFLDVPSAFEGHASRHASVALGRGRTLNVALDFAEIWPSVSVRYVDPEFEAESLGDATPAESGPPHATEAGRPERIVRPEGPAMFRWFVWQPVPATIGLFVIVLLLIVGHPGTLAAAGRATRAAYHAALTTLDRLFGRRPLPSRLLSTDTPSLPLVPPRQLSAADRKLAVDSGTVLSATIDVASLEVEALAALDQAGLLLGEQASVERLPGGLHVTVTADTAERRAELRHSLGPIARRRGVAIEIKTLDEVLRHQSAGGASAVREQWGEISNEPAALYDDLRRYFESTSDASGAQASRTREDVDARVRAFSTRLLNQSLQARLHARVISQMVERFTPDEVRALPADQFAKWRSVIRDHAEAFARDTAAVRSALEPILFARLRRDAAPVRDAAPTLSALPQMGNELFALASAHDAAVARALAISADQEGPVLLRSEGFWKSLVSAEEKAREIHLIVSDESHR